MAEKYKTRTERMKQQTKTKAKQKPKSKARKIIKTIFLTFLIIGLVGMITGVTTFAIYAKDAPPLDDVLLIDPVASQLFDMNGDVYAVLGEEKREYVEYDKIPEEVVDAVLATEDVRFFKHSGIDLRRLAGAVLANVTRGFGSEGASTLTQQVVKLSYLSKEKTLKRKAQEAWLAMKLEQEYTKKQIFEIYINKIYYGNGIHGIETAAKFYFDKNLDELELQERAFLAGMPQSPNNYDPYKYLDKADKRKNIVLSLMYQHGKISKEEMESAKEISVSETLIPEEENNKSSYKYDSFVDQVIREVESMGEEYNVYTDGLKIYTTLDPNAQEYTEKMFFTDEIVQFPNDEMQAGLVLTDTKTGEIRAIGGNRYKDIKRGRNFATQLSDRQPGSTVKPIFDYGPAIEYLNWSTYEQVVDEPYKYNTGQSINNFDQGYLGQMSIREALYRSRNIPALKAYQAAGKDKVREFAAKLGIDHDQVENEAASIGGLENISPLKLAGAYATFGNNGIYNKPHTVKKIILRDEETEIVNKISPEIAMKESTAYMVTDMLKDVLSNKAGATGRTAIIPGLPAAAKTGTTNYTPKDMQDYGVSKNDVPDAWFAGYTTNYTIAVWTGYEKRSIPLRAGTNDQQIAKELYKNLMAHVSEGIETPDFQMPKSVVRAEVEKGSNPAKKPSKYTPDSHIVRELFVVGTEPKEVSTNYDKLEAPSVNGEYKEAENQIQFSWEHPELDEKELKFDVTIKMSNGKNEALGQVNELSYTLQNVEPEITYTIEVVAVSGNQKSSAGTASVTVPKKEEAEEEKPDPGDENNKEPDKDQNQDGQDQHNNDNGGQNNNKPKPDNGNNPGQPNPPGENGNRPEDNEDSGEADQNEEDNTDETSTDQSPNDDQSE